MVEAWRKTTSSPEPDDPATRYARDVAEGRIIAGPHVRGSCNRHLKDLVEGPARGLEWRPDKAQRVYDFFEKLLKLPGGEFEARPFELLPFQKFIVGSLFGWTRKADGYRRFRTAYLEMGKGNGKSPLDAGMVLYMMVADGEPRAECFSAGSSKDQARVVFDSAVSLIDLSPALKKRIQQNGQNPVWELVYLHDPATKDARRFKPISKVGGKSGPIPHAAVLGELHEWPDDYLLRMMRFGVKSRRQPLILIETNSGSDLESVCGQQHKYGVGVADGTLIDDEYFSYVCGLDPEDEENDRWMDDPACWIKGSPGIGIITKHAYVEGLIREARHLPARRAEVARLIMCQWRSGDDCWIEYELWDGAKTDVGLDALKGLPCWLGLDLSGSRDLTALSAVWVDDGERGLGAAGDLWCHTWFWMPKPEVKRRQQEDNATYQEWIEQGHLTAVDSPSIDAGFVAVQVAELQQDHDVKGLAYDSWRMKDMLRAMQDIGLKHYEYQGPTTNDQGKEVEPEPGEGLMLVRHAQGFQGGMSKKSLWMPRSINTFEQVIVDGRFRWRANPVLNWCSANAKHVTDPKKNRAWEKIVVKSRIDGIVAACMAVGLAEAKIPTEPTRPSIEAAILARGGLL